MRVIKLLCIGLLLLLSGCGVFAQTPPESAIRLAIAQQLTHMQQGLSKDLGLTQKSRPANRFEPNFKVDKVYIQRRDKVTNSRILGRESIDEAYRVQGTFDATLLGPSKQKFQQNSSFDLLLGTDSEDVSEVKTWFLLQP
ncbi:MAG: hypothetical protein AAFY33_08430 [Cyanobacteria bacterium J06643_4]